MHYLKDKIKKIDLNLFFYFISFFWALLQIFILFILINLNVYLFAIKF